METALTLSYVGLGLLTIGLLYVMWLIIRRNQMAAQSDNEPLIAGADELTGAAKNPEQFKDPDDDALDQMDEVLQAAAESQGIEYKE